MTLESTIVLILWNELHMSIVLHCTLLFRKIFCAYRIDSHNTRAVTVSAVNVGPCVSGANIVGPQIMLSFRRHYDIMMKQ